MKIMLPPNSRKSLAPSLFLLVVISFALMPSLSYGAWYEGGSLHRSDISAWKSSSYSNKLATAADWSLKSRSVKTKVQRSGDINSLRKYADKLVTCIDTATKGLSVTGSTTQYAASCMKLMGW